jgi:hypothetical protein
MCVPNVNAPSLATCRHRAVFGCRYAAVTGCLSVRCRALEVAAREGAKAIVTGSVANVDGAFTVNVKIVSAERGDVLAAFLRCSSGVVWIQSCSR